MHRMHRNLCVTMILQVVSTVRQWCSNPQLHTWAVRGNHDESALKAARLHAQQQPVGAKYHWVGSMQPEDVQFLARCPFSLQVQGYALCLIVMFDHYV